MLDYPSHSPDLAPVIFMFPTLKERCQDIVSPVMKMATGHMFRVSGMGTLITYCDKFLKRQGNYVQK